MGCSCLIRHATTPEERKQVHEGINYSRSVGCSVGFVLGIAQLQACPTAGVPADPEAPKSQILKTPKKGR